MSERCYTMSLNPAQVKNLKPEPGRKVTRIHDGSGLYLYITDKGSKRWRFKYLFKGKNQMLSVGTYPTFIGYTIKLHHFQV